MRLVGYGVWRLGIFRSRHEIRQRVRDAVDLRKLLFLLDKFLVANRCAAASTRILSGLVG